MDCIFDSRQTRYKRPFGAVPCGTPVEFNIDLPYTGGFYAPSLILYDADRWQAPHAFGMDFIQSCKGHNFYTCTVTVDTPSLLFYHFTVCTLQGERKLTRGADNYAVFAEDGGMWQFTVYEEVYDEPEFLDQGIFYQVFPDRFCRSKAPDNSAYPERTLHENWLDLPDYLPNAQGEVTNSDYFGGDLQGVISKLDYLESLGVSCLYLNPIFEAHSNHRYNTADYTKVDPFLGTNEDFTQLCTQAKSRGIRVILDGVFSHTGDDSIYFNRRGRYPGPGACQGPDSPYYSWYHFDSFPDRYRCWWGFPTLPEVEELGASYQDYLFGEGGIIEQWMRRGAAGFRLDVADELPDAFIERLTGKVKALDPQALVLGEVWEDASNKISYDVRRRYLLGRQLDSVMNYPFKDAVLGYIRYGDGAAFCDTVLSLLEHYPKRVTDRLMNSLSTHDTERALTLLSTQENVPDRQWQASHHHLPQGALEYGKRRLRLAMVLQYFLPGVPCLYYGDEAGLYGYRDPFNRCAYPWGQEDAQLLDFVRRLGEIRTDNSWVSRADFTPVLFWDTACGFVRSRGDHALLILVNRSQSPARVDIPDAFWRGEVLLGSFHMQEKALEPFGYAVIKARGLWEPEE